MNQVQAKKYNIAWFRLAECISRREKERALGVYRLLSHSLDNQAVGYQLEGDILLAFADTKTAILRYEQAALAYAQQQEIMQAVAVYDHLFTLKNNHNYLEQIIELYAQLKDRHKLLCYIKHLCQVLLQQQSIDAAVELLKRFDMNMSQKASVLQDVCFNALQDTQVDRQIALKWIYLTLQRMMHDAHMMQQFLVKLKVYDEQAYKMACAFIQNCS